MATASGEFSCSIRIGLKSMLPDGRGSRVERGYCSNNPSVRRAPKPCTDRHVVQHSTSGQRAFNGTTKKKRGGTAAAKAKACDSRKGCVSGARARGRKMCIFRR